MHDDAFFEEWSAIEARVRAFVRSKVRDEHAADDIVQETLIRCCRGFATFRRDCPILSWALRVARHEIIRYWQQQRKFERNEQDALIDNVPADEPEHRDDQLDTAASIEKSVESGFLTREQAAVLQVRLENSDMNWSDIGKLLGISGNAGAVTHWRAVRSFRVYLFVHQPSRFGDATTVAEAFDRASRRAVNPLTQQEREAFLLVIIERKKDPHARGNLGPLRDACEKVAVELELD